jgi:hypothetical protein
MKPVLTLKNRVAGVDWCVSKLTHTNQGTYFAGMFNTVHIDKKWFFLTKSTTQYYLLPEEEEPYRACKSKRFITKVMFLACAACPRYDTHGNEIFDGKVGIFPLVERVQARRKSANREAGALETKAITVTWDIMRETLVHKVLPAIKGIEVFRGQTVYIQQDNASPHILPTDPVFMEAAARGGWDIRLGFQPPNSPDLNVLNLGFFAGIQALHQRTVCRTINDLVTVVEEAFDNYPAMKLNKTFLTLQSAMIKILRCEGGDHYKIPHVRKDYLISRSALPITLKCPVEVVRKARVFLDERRSIIDLDSQLLDECRAWEEETERNNSAPVESELDYTEEWDNNDDFVES